ncbi:hypothetical protein PPHE_b0483 [Pseudoalteromonas phenolica O-BC30]|nr:hypothetical protein [Pseudoalteromonas phenolica O-BC30]
MYVQYNYCIRIRLGLGYFVCILGAGNVVGEPLKTSRSEARV